jgi:mannose-6-phosphate isomerase-like protein (cupin superfamily)
MGKEEKTTQKVDFGPNPYVTNIDREVDTNPNYRKTLWTGKNLQVTLMTINRGEDVGLEVHPDNDQFFRVEAGEGRVDMGPTKDEFNFQRDVDNESVILIPAGMWHNITNTGKKPLRLYSIYAPSHHPRATLHPTKADADAAEAAEHGAAKPATCTTGATPAASASTSAGAKLATPVAPSTPLSF